MAADIWPYMVIENKEFKHMVKVLEPRHNVPSCVHVSQSVVTNQINHSSDVRCSC